MSSVTLPATGVGSATPKVATEQLPDTSHAQLVKLLDGAPGSTTPVTPLTDAQLRALAVAISGTVALDSVTLAALETITVANPTTNPETGLAKDATLGGRFAGGKLSKGAQVTASGDTTIHTPASGKAIRLYWVSAINDPDAAASPRIIVKWATSGTELYRAYAIAHWEIFTGAINEPLAVNLDQAGDVAVTLHYAEI